MKINKPFFVIKTIENLTLIDELRVSLNTACFKFAGSKKENTIDAAKELVISQRIAISQYLTGLKIVNFADNAAINDTITLEEEINDFLKQYNKLTK